MRDRMERFLVLPFAIGCASETSIPLRKSSSDHAVQNLSREQKTRRQQIKKTKKTDFTSFLGLSKPKISSCFLRLIQSIKSFSRIFVLHKEDGEETEEEFEIGFPTDVKHVTHIGLDGSRTTNPVAGWENLYPTEVISFPSISVKQFELAMAAQSNQQSHNVDLYDVINQNLKA